MGTYDMTDEEKRQFGFDWSDWLTTGEILASSTWTVSGSAATILTSSYGSTSSAVWLEGVTAGESVTIKNVVTTDTEFTSGEFRTGERSHCVKIVTTK